MRRGRGFAFGLVNNCAFFESCMGFVRVIDCFIGIDLSGLLVMRHLLILIVLLVFGVWFLTQ